MADFDYGEELAAARKRAGLSVQQVSDAIRIRPDIIRALEMSDFDRMPAKGFARNHVSAYARFLGLDSTEMTSQFLKAHDEFDGISGFSRSGDDQQSSSAGRSRSRSRGHARVNDESKAQPGYRHDRHKRRTLDRNFESAFDENDDSDGSGFDRREAGSHRRDSRSGGSEERPIKRKRPAVRQPVRPMGGSRRSEDGIIGSEGFRPGGKGLSKFRPIVIVALVIVLAIVIIVLVQCSSGASGQTSEDSDQAANAVQVTGGSSSSSVLPDDSDDALTAMPEDLTSSATSFTVVVDVADGESSWVQVTTDDTTSIAEEVTGPQELSYTATQTASLQIGNVAAVTVSLNGDEVTLDTDDDGLGSLTLTLEDGQVVTG